MEEKEGEGGGDDDDEEEEEGIRPISGRLMEPMERSEEEDAALFNGHRQEAFTVRLIHLHTQ